MPSKSVLAVGGGMIGLSVAYYAMQKGHQVTVVERGCPAHDACPLGNAGMVVPRHFVPLAAPGMIGLGLRMMWHPESPFSIRPRLSRDLVAPFLPGALQDKHQVDTAPLRIHGNRARAC